MRSPVATLSAGPEICDWIHCTMIFAVIAGGWGTSSSKYSTTIIGAISSER